jgi:long-chain acyl-CoA synthetase
LTAAGEPLWRRLVLPPGRDPGHVAIREPAGDWTYGRLLAAAEAAAAVLRDAGVDRGHRVGLMIANSGAFAAGFLGIASRGAVIAPFNPRYREQELVFFSQDTAARAVVVAPELAPAAERALDTMASPPALVVMDDGGAARRARPGGKQAVALTADDRTGLALLQQYTSGSTGRPKRVIRTDRMLAAELAALARVFELGAADRLLGAAPFSHVNGLVRTCLSSLFAGATLYPVADFQRRSVLDLITRERITFFGGVPYMYAILAETPQRGHVDLSSLRVAFSSSAPLRAEDQQRFGQRYGVPVRQLYGSTEAGTISVNIDPDPEAAATVGTPLPGVEVSVVDDAGRPAPPDAEGEIVVSSPWAIRAYEGNERATAESFREGAYRSGDLGRRDRQGRLTLTGRLKLLINRGGFKVNPEEVQAAIQSHPKVQEVVVLGAPARFGDDLVRAVVVASAPCTPDEIVEHCRARIADFKIPGLVEFRDALPKSATGKILRHEL